MPPPLCSRRHFAFLLLLIMCSGRLAGAPADEISRAILIGGSPGMEAASPAQCLRGYSSVLIRVQAEKFSDYLTAAVKLRPDLAGPIAAATLRAHRLDLRASCEWVRPIIHAALAAAPKAKDAIIRAALEAEPSARECILAIAGWPDEDAPPGEGPNNGQASAGGSGPIGTINPANSSGGNNEQSGNQERTTICHNGNTLTLPRSSAEAHLSNHRNDYLGPCRR